MDVAMDFQMELETAVQSFEAQSLSSLVSSPRSPTLSEQEVDEEVLAFLYDGRRSPSATPEPTWNNFSLDVVNAMSPASVNTVISAGTLVMDLSEFLQTIADRRSLQKAEIRSVEQYWVWTGTVYHRFLILELDRGGRKAVWVRLDRHRGGGLMELATGTSPAHDEALLKADKGSLIRGAVLENKQTFAATLTLGELKFLLEAITEEMKFYTVWPDNCYFFCSLIQQHLGEMNHGIFILGELYRPAMAQDVRDKVSERVRSICQRPVKPSLKMLFQNLDPWRSWPYAQEFLKLSSELDHPDPPLSIRSNAARRLCQLVVEVHVYLCRTYDRTFALSVHRSIHQYLNQIPDWGNAKTADMPDNLRLYYYMFLHSYSLLLPEPVHPTTLLSTAAEQDASIRGELFVEFPAALDHYKAGLRLPMAPSFDGDAEREPGIIRFPALFSDDARESLIRQSLSLELYGISLGQAEALFSDDAIESWIHQSSSLELYATALGTAGNFNEACDVYGLLVDLQRHLFTSHARQHRNLLSHSLHKFGMHLCEAGRLQEAFAASVEAVTVSVMRDLYICFSIPADEMEIDGWGEEIHEVCTANAQNVELMRMLCARDAGRYQQDFSSSLYQYSVTLSEAGRFSEACVASAEDFALKCMFHATDARERNWQLSKSFNHYCECLGSAGRSDEVSGVNVQYNRTLFAKDPDRHRSDVAKSLQDHAFQLGRVGRYVEACDASAEDVELKRVLYAMDADQHRAGLSTSLHHYSISLRQAGRYSKACDAGAEDVKLSRVLYSRDADKHLWVLSSSLHNYGISLREAGRFDEACDAGAEDVELQHVLYARFSEHHRRWFSTHLHHYSISLRKAGRFIEACEAGAEDVELMRVLYASDAKQHRWNLAVSLHNYGISLREAGRFSEASDAGLEAVDLIRVAYAMDADKHRADTIEVMRDYGESLRAASRLGEADEIEEEAEALQATPVTKK